MALSARLYAQPSMQQTVSRQVVLQGQILELTADDLRERVEAELEENPALEMADDVYYLPAPPTSMNFSAEAGEAVEWLRAPHTLADDLRLQLAAVRGELRPICDYLIECLDERGFVDADLDGVARQLRVPEADVRAALDALQRLEPAGVGARDLRECLLLQVARLPRKQVPARTAEFITAFLGRAHLTTPTAVGEALGLTRRQLLDIVEFIGQKLYMWPSDCFRTDSGATDSQAALPDAAVSWDGETLVVRVVQTWSGNLRVSEAWTRLERQLRRGEGTTGREAERVAEYIREARSFIDFLARRELMLKRLTEEIVACQLEFFIHGRQALTPLTRKEIAASVGVHESTVSRTTAGKFVQLPNMQLVPYSFFFDGSVSAKSVLRSLIEREKPCQPLSDAMLAERLQAAGYPLARRTVGKYRGQMGIPDAHQRRAAL